MGHSSGVCNHRQIQEYTDFSSMLSSGNLVLYAILRSVTYFELVFVKTLKCVAWPDLPSPSVNKCLVVSAPLCKKPFACPYNHLYYFCQYLLISLLQFYWGGTC